jgi:hypothetical protein
MLVSGREAATILAAAGLGRDAARSALAGGLAGVPLRLKGTLLYEEYLVRALAERPHAVTSNMTRQCRRGTFVARLNPLSTRRTEPGWHVSPWARVWIHHAISTVGYYPFVATISGFVTEGAEIVGVAVHPAAKELRTSFVTRPAGEWFDAFQGTRFKTGPGGPWLIWRAPPTLPELQSLPEQQS